MALLALGTGVFMWLLCVGGTLSATRLNRALIDFDVWVQPVVHLTLESRRTLGGLAFVTGAVLGWLTAWQWMTVRQRQRSLVIADLRRGDMLFAEGIDHVRHHAGRGVHSDAMAVKSILEAAGRGKVSLWREAPSGALRRIPARQIRTAATQFAALGAPLAMSQKWTDLTLLREEVERCWPRAATRRIVRVAPDY